MSLRLLAGALNDDGKPDLAFSRRDHVYVLLNQGTAIPGHRPDAPPRRATDLD